MEKKTIALIAHDSRKKELEQWAIENKEILRNFNLIATKTTGSFIEKIPIESQVKDGDLYIPYNDHLSVTKVASGPWGGDQMIGSLIAQNKIDIVIFFCDNLIMQGHQTDIQALFRLASLYDIAFASNVTTANIIINSNLI